MRVFLGIKASENLQKEIKSWQCKHADLPVRFIKSENLHITLIPPWYTDDMKSDLAKIENINFSGFNIVFDKLFINFRSRVIWVEPIKIPDEIINLQIEAAELFERKNEKRQYKPHLTLARFKNTKLLKSIFFEQINWPEKIDNITLFESKLHPQGAVYHIICQHKF